MAPSEAITTRPFTACPVCRCRSIRKARIGFATFSLYRDLAAFQPDVAHLLHPVATGIPAMAMLKWLEVPTVTSFHLDYARLAHQFRLGTLDLGFARPLIDELTKNVFNWADYSLAPSRLVQRQMRRLGISRVGLWRRGVDAAAFHPGFRSAAMREEMTQGNPDDTVLLYVGRLSLEKQIEHIRPVLEQIPNTRLVVVGDGPARAALEREFAGQPAAFMGYLRGRRLSQAYASADIFVFPSRLETFGLVVIEAMASGLPVVAGAGRRRGRHRHRRRERLYLRERRCRGRCLRPCEGWPTTASSAPGWGSKRALTPRRNPGRRSWMR